MPYLHGRGQLRHVLAEAAVAGDRDDRALAGRPPRRRSPPGIRSRSSRGSRTSAPAGRLGLEVAAEASRRGCRRPRRSRRRRAACSDSAAKTAALATPRRGRRRARLCFSARHISQRAATSVALVGGVLGARAERGDQRARRDAGVAEQRHGDRVEPADAAAGRRRSGRSACTARCRCGLRTRRRPPRAASASFISQLATGVPLRPSTPAAERWVSGTRPFARNVVSTGAPRRSASAMTSAAGGARAVPTMIDRALRAGEQLQRLGEALRRAARSAGRERRPCGAAGSASGAGRTWTSSGNTSARRRAPARRGCTASAASSAWSLRRRGRSRERRDVAEGRRRGRSPGRRPCRAPDGRPGRRSRSRARRPACASHRPVSRLVDPGPAIVRQAAGRPVSLP